MKSGPLILKTVLCDSHIDINVTSTALSPKLSNLDTYIATVGNDITKLNVHFNTLIQSIIARGDMGMDLLANIFKG